MLAAAAVVAFLGAMATPPVARPTTLAAVLRANGLDAGPGDLQDLERPVTSFAVLGDTLRPLVAYYLEVPDRALLPPLRLAVRDGARWREARLLDSTDGSTCLGSVSDVRGWGQGFLITTHLSPSASCTLVVSPDLKLLDTLGGWVSLALPNGLLVYETNQAHFAATHPLEMALYDSVTRQSRPLFPLQPYGRARSTVIAEQRGIYLRLGDAWCSVNNDCDEERPNARRTSDPVFSSATDSLAFTVELEVRDPAAGLTERSVDVLVVARGLSRPQAIELRELELGWVRGRLGDQPLAKYLEPPLLGQLFAETP